MNDCEWFRIDLVVCDGVEEVVVAGIKAGMHHGTGDTKHSSTSVLNFNIQGVSVTAVTIF